MAFRLNFQQVAVKKGGLKTDNVDLAGVGFSRT